MNGVLRDGAWLDLAELRRRLARGASARGSLPGDAGASPADAGLKPAAVLVPIVAHDERATMLFTRRSARLRDHSGQVSFPGGRAEPRDPNPEFTALRETVEEIGLDTARVEIVARLPDYCTRTGYRITPVVGVLTPPLALSPDSFEVDEVFEVPLAFLLDPRNHEQRTREIRGEARSFYVIAYGRHTIWGATAGMLVNLYRRLAETDAAR